MENKECKIVCGEKTVATISCKDGACKNYVFEGQNQRFWQNENYSHKGRKRIL